MLFMKICSKCKQNKSTIEFIKNINRKDGLHCYCKLCHKNLKLKWIEANPERYAKWYDKDKSNARHALWRKNNPEKWKKQYSAYNALWKKKNPGKWNAIAAKYIASKIKRTPPWLTKSNLLDIQHFYIVASNLTNETGCKMNVDHIIPLQGKNVSGLHVPWNLQIISQTENCSKGNRL